MRCHLSLTELEPMLRTLPRAEKFQLVQLLVNELARDEDTAVQIIQETEAFAVWTPLHAHAAAESLLLALETEQTSA